MARAALQDRPALGVRIAAFAAVVGDGEAQQVFGAVADEAALPKAVRRRLSPFDLGVARCIVGLAGQGSNEEIVFASRHGNMAVMTDLLVQIAQNEILSPAKFSMAVHNAAVGVSSQITGNRGGHTSVAAGTRSLSAGLTEGWLRLQAGSPSVVVCYSDLRVPEVYTEFDEPGENIQLAMRLAGEETGGHQLDDGRIGARALLDALAGGAGAVSWRA